MAHSTSGRRRLRSPLIVLLIATLLLAACGGGDTDDPSSGATDGTGGSEGATSSEGGEAAADATFVYAAAGVPETLDVWTNYGGDPSRVQMYEWGSTLVQYDPEAVDDPCETMATTENIRPALAESWEVADDGTITFKLREGVMSHAGNELTAEDVVWSLDRARTQSTVVQFLMANVSHFPEKGAFTAVDDLTVEVKVDRPTALDVSVFTYPMFMIHDSKEIQEQAGAGDKLGNEWLIENTANFGPWVLESFEPGQEATYTAHEDFWDAERRGNISELVIRNVGESTTRMQLIETREADYAERLSFQEYSDLQDSGSGVQVQNCISPNRDSLIMNNKFGPFGDPDVRKAISLAINREALVEGVYLGFAEPSTTGMSRIYMEDTEGLATFEHNVDEAKSLLQEAGEEDLSFTIMASPTRPGAHAESLAVQIQSMLEDAGVKAKIDVVPGSTEFSDAFFAGEYEAVIYLEPPALGDPYYSANLYNSTVSFQNTFKYDNQEYDDLTVEIEQTPPGDARQEAIRAISDLIVEDTPMAYLVERSYTHAFAQGVSGYLNTPHGSLMTYLLTKEE